MPRDVRHLFTLVGQQAEYQLARTAVGATTIAFVATAHSPSTAIAFETSIILLTRC